MATAKITGIAATAKMPEFTDIHRFDDVILSSPSILDSWNCLTDLNLGLITIFRDDYEKTIFFVTVKRKFPREGGDSFAANSAPRVLAARLDRQSR